MLKITKQADYAVMILARMSELPGDGPYPARDAAAWCGLTLPMVSKILKTLARAGLVMSHRGVSGGYCLASPANEISVAAVIRALEGPIGLVECATQPGQCEHEPNCPTRVNWSRINVEIERALERVPVSEMLTGCQSRTDLLSLPQEP